MMFDAEAVLASRVVDRRGNGSLERRARSEIFDPSARVADQVMVMPGEFLGEFEAREVVAGDDALHDFGGFEHHQIAIGAALRELGVGVEDFGERQGTIAAGQHGQEQAAPFGESLVHSPQPSIGDGHDVVAVAAHSRPS